MRTAGLFYSFWAGIACMILFVLGCERKGDVQTPKVDEAQVQQMMEEAREMREREMEGRPREFMQ